MSVRPPYYRRPGGGRPSVQTDAAIFQLAKRAAAGVPLPNQTKSPQLPSALPAPPAPAGSVSVQSPLQLDQGEISLPPASGTQAGWVEMTGDLGGSGDAPVVVGLQGVGVDAAAPSVGDVLEYDGTKWKPTALPVPSTGSPDEAWDARSANFTMSASSPNVAVDTSGGNVTVTLPQASAYLAGAHPALTVKIYPGSHSIVLTAHAGDNIDGGATSTITNVQQTLTVKVRADGTGWLSVHPHP